MADSVDLSFTCCICEEVYDEFNTEPLLWSGSNSFCKRCLQKMLMNKEKLCPACRSDPTEHSMLVKIKSPPRNVCDNHVFAFWCKSCQVSVCKLCLQRDHKLCDWICVEEKIDDLMKVLKKTALATRKNLTDFFSRAAADNTENLSNLRGLIKRLKKYEKTFRMLEKLIPIEKAAAMRCLDGLQNQPAEASVADYTTAIANAGSLRGDHIQYPKALDFTFKFKSRNAAPEDITTDLRNSKDTTNDVNANKSSSSFALYFTSKNIFSKYKCNI